MGAYHRRNRRRSEVWMRVKDGASIRSWRKRRNLSQRDLAYLARCSQNAISLIEQGKLLTLSEDLAIEIAHRLDVPWEELFVIRDSSGVRRVAHGAHSTRRKVAA